MEFVDRTVDPIYEVNYGIPFEDTDVTPDEVDNSRTHQFFAVCRQTSPQENLPAWITMTDVDETALVFPEFNPPANDQIFELNSSWDGCWFRINEDVDRRPITDAMAAQPVPWDTTGIPEGVYFLWGYTYEPVFNLWTPRMGGVVRVHDGGDPASSGPAAAVTTGEQTPCVGDTVQMEGCVNALPGTTMTGYYAVTSGPGTEDPNWQPDWVPFVENVAVEGDAFTIDWDAPEEAGGESAMLRIDFTDTNGVTYTAYQYELNIVLPAGSAGCAADPDDCAAGFIQDPACETTGADGTDTGDTAGTGTTGETSGASATDNGSSTAGESGDDPGNDGGCGCRTRGGSPTALGLLALMGLLGIRRRR
jgi:MYXO-CTERM domain-containing protein